MSSQAIFTSFKEAVAFYAGWDRTTATWSTDRNNMFEVIKKDALSRFENEYNWSFLYVQESLELVPSFATGSIAIVAGVVTATADFPSWAAQGDLWVEDDGEMRRYSVNTRDGNDQITLDDTSVNVASTDSFTLRRHYYDLPSNFGGTLDWGFAFRRDSIYAGRVIQKVGHADFQHWDREYGSVTGVPCKFMLQAIAPTATASTAWRVAFTPLPGDTMFLDYRYRIVAADVDSTNDYPVGGALHSATILASIRLSTATYVRPNDRPAAEIEYQRNLEQSLRLDRNNRPIDYGPGKHGYYRSYDGRHCHGSIDDATLFV